MAYGSYLGNGFKTVFFNALAAKQLRDDPNGFKYGIITLLIVSVLSAIGVAIFASIGAAITAAFPGAAGAAGIEAANVVILSIVTFIVALIGSFIVLGILHLFAKLFGGVARFKDWFGVAMAVSFALGVIGIGVMILGIIPIIGWLLIILWPIYELIVLIFAVRETYAISTGRAVGAVLIPIVILIILSLLPLLWFIPTGPEAYMAP